MTSIRTVPVRAVLLVLLGCAGGSATGDPAHDREVSPGYRQPPKPIARMLDAPPTPTALASPGAETVALLGRSSLPPIADFAGPVLGLAGYRIDPDTNGPASGRVHGLTSITFVDVEKGAGRDVDLPDDARFIAPRWSPAISASRPAAVTYCRHGGSRRTAMRCPPRDSRPRSA